jgi:hypothetical protein
LSSFIPITCFYLHLKHMHLEPHNVKYLNVMWRKVMLEENNVTADNS